MTTIPELSYDDWLDRCVIDRLAGAAPPADAPVAAPTHSIPATYIARAIHEQAANTIQIIGGLRCVGLRIDGDLHIENHAVPFSLFFHSCTFTGDLYIWSLKAHTVAFLGCALQGADIRSTRIDGHLLLRKSVALGPIIARDMEVSSTVDVDGATFAYDGAGASALKEAASGDCFGFSRSRATTLIWKHLGAKPAGMVTLRDAHVRSFIHDANEAELASWPTATRLILDGFSYDRIEQWNVKIAMAWLDLQAKFSASSYSALAKGYEKLNLRQDADLVWTALKKHEVAQLEPPARRYLIRFVYWLVGYGQQPFLALFAVILLFLAHLGVVNWAQETHRMQPLINEMLLEPCFYHQSGDCTKKLKDWRSAALLGGEQRFVPKDYPEFNSVEYSLESFIPLLQFEQDKYWEPEEPWLRILLPTIAAFGIFIGGVFVGGISGLISPRSRDR
ncbi:hypothetical protein [Phenylobacterium montanum]|uniref:Uncharacterized protein n=1 Tax=Phenylobacterium montanum TaxID=2823693 RepID=A0A975FYV3_9CAUL|nr:hypothetical protein [Caulobacter sp. S6]QUD87805.1 hypothetical protein KCG34_22625 [Caulobacter sp. S6]